MTYPRPQLVRPQWTNIDGPWRFTYEGPDFDRVIQVPFPPESPASGIGDTGFHDVVRYQRHLTPDEIAATGWAPGRRLVLHFGAVDYRCTVWLNGHRLGDHDRCRRVQGRRQCGPDLRPGVGLGSGRDRGRGGRGVRRAPDPAPPPRWAAGAAARISGCVAPAAG